MGLNELRNLGAPTPNSGEYVDLGNPGQKATALGQVGDQLRGTFIETPILMVAVAYLYHKAVISGNDNRSWGFGDVLFVVIVAHALKRFGVGRRWKEVASRW